MYGVEISSLSSRIAKWCDAPIGSCRPPLIAALSAPRWAIRRVVSANALRPLSEKSIVTIGGPPAPFSKVCSGFLMSEPLRTGLSLMTHQLSTWPRCWSTGRRSSSRSTMMPSGTSSTSARSVSFCDVEVLTQRLLVLLGAPVEQRRVRLVVERVPKAGGRVVVVDLRRALRRALDRVVETARLLTPVDLLRVGLAVRVEDVRLPVVKVHLGRRADLIGGALGVLDARQADVDLVPTGLQQLWLRHPERVHALAHDVQSPLQRLRRNRWLLRRRLASYTNCTPPCKSNPSLVSR